MVALILALAFVARLAEIALDIGYASPARTASRLGQRQNPQQRGPSQYFNRLSSLDLGQQRGFVSKEAKRKVSQFCLLDILRYPPYDHNRILREVVMPS
jgi:hypothetical protein